MSKWPTGLLRGAGLARMTLRGVGQVFLCGHAGAGLCFLAAVAAQSAALVLACLLGALTGTLWGLRHGRRADCEAGLHGYNGALAGIAVLIALPSTPLAWALAAGLAWLATWMAAAWHRRLPGSPYTAPFILVTWLLLAAIPVAGWTPAEAVVPAAAADGAAAWLAALLRGVGQVMFLDDPLAGALCVLGLAWAAPSAAGRALAASALMLAAGWLLGLPADPWRMGLYGFNAVLASEAIHQALPGRRAAWCAGLALSLLLLRGFQLLDWPALTAPFVLATWGVRLGCRPLSLFKA